MRWNNLVLRDLRNCNLDGVWRILAEDRNEWRNQVWAATQEVNFKKEEQEKYRKDEQKNVAVKQGKRHQSLLYTAALMVVDLLL